MNKELVAQLIAMPEHDWRSLTLAMSWALRRGDTTPPDGLPLRTMPSAEAWDEVRSAVKAARRRRVYAAKIKAKRAKKDRRREYMRNYMRDYRDQRKA